MILAAISHGEVANNLQQRIRVYTTIKDMAWYEEDSWATAAFAANKSTIFFTIILAFALPILVHLYIYRSRASTSTPTFLVLGPSGSGKTSLVTKVPLYNLTHLHDTLLIYAPARTRHPSPNPHLNERVQIARDLLDLTWEWEQRIRRAASAEEAAAQMMDYVERRVMLRFNALGIRAPEERVQANEAAQQQHEEEGQMPIAADVQLEQRVNGNLDLNMRVPDHPPRLIDNLRHQDDVVHGPPVQHDGEDTPAEDENALPTLQTEVEEPDATVMERAHQVLRDLDSMNFELRDDGNALPTTQTAVEEPQTQATLIERANQMIRDLDSINFELRD